MARLQKYRIIRSVDLALRGVYMKLTGDIDAPDTPEIEASLQEWIHHHGGSVVLDIRDIRYQSSALIYLFCRLHAETRMRGEALVLLTNAFQDRLLKIVRLHRLFTTAKSKDEAALLVRKNAPFPSLGVPA
jgi:anti-anti-sigma factor